MQLVSSKVYTDRPVKYSLIYLIYTVGIIYYCTKGVHVEQTLKGQSLLCSIPKDTFKI
jgi:hypothetical protein